MSDDFFDEDEESDEERDSRRHIVGHEIPEAVDIFEAAQDLDVEIVTMPGRNGGQLIAGGNLRHGAGFRNQVTPYIRARAAELREQLLLEYPGIDELSLPTVELYCMAMSRSIALNNHIEEYVEGSRTRRLKGKTLSGIEAVPAYLWAEAGRAEANAAKFAQDLGLDLTGRAKALKDDAITKSLNGRPTLEALGARGRKLQALRGREPGKRRAG